MGDTNTGSERKLSGLVPLLTFFSAILTLTAFAMSVNAIPPVITSVVDDFGISTGAFGYLFSVQFFVFMAASFAGGAFLKKTGTKPGALVAFGLAGLSILYFIMPLLSNFMELMIWILLLGFSGGLVETFATVLVSGYDSQGSGRFLSFSQIFYCVGAIAAPRIVAYLFDKHFPWESIFTLFGFLELFLALFFVIFSINDILGLSDPSEDSGKMDSRKSVLFITDPAFILLGLSIFVYVLGESFMVFWFPVYLENYYSFSPANAARGISFYWIGLIVGRAAAAVIPVRFSLWRLLFISAAGMLVFAAALSFRWSKPNLVLMTLLIGLFSGPVWATIVSLGSHTSGEPQFVAGVIGVGSLGASIGPLVSSAIIKYGGFRFFFPSFSAGMVILLFLIYFSKNQIDKEEIFT